MPGKKKKEDRNGKYVFKLSSFLVIHMILFISFFPRFLSDIVIASFEVVLE